jgi:hypothetical protein
LFTQLSPHSQSELAVQRRASLVWQRFPMHSSPVPHWLSDEHSVVHASSMHTWPAPHVWPPHRVGAGSLLLGASDGDGVPPLDDDDEEEDAPPPELT